MGILVKVKFEFPKIEKKVDKKNLMRFFKNELVNFWVLDFLDFEKIMSSKKVDKFFFVNFSIFHLRICFWEFCIVTHLVAHQFTI